MNLRSPTLRRQTRQRHSIYEAVAATNSHPTAEWVYEQVRRSLPRISLGTVYRNLQLLVGEGKLKAW
ncbi:MAG TPA: transcriptional repressor, partial [Thermoanaerobaculia bacterium]|nr:transcriptional repressor [Thermoanaerobaculia bacterium]